MDEKDLDLSGIVPSYEIVERERPAVQLMNKYCKQYGVDHWVKLPKSIIEKCLDSVREE